MKIWLDDVRDPADENTINLFMSSPDMTWIKTAEEAIKLINSGKVSFISFDNDLGTVLEGYDVAKHIEKLAFENKVSKIEYRIHTANYVARGNITQAMRNADKFWNVP